MNALKSEEKTKVVSLLCEGVSIRATERITGVRRGTVMRLGVRVGQACAKIQDERFRKLN
jgi:transposase-like protein